MATDGVKGLKLTI